MRRASRASSRAASASGRSSSFAVTGITVATVAILVSPALRNVIESLGRSIGNALGL